MRTILLHLNLAVADGDERDARELAQIVMDSLHVGLEGYADATDDAVPMPVLALVDEV